MTFHHVELLAADSSAVDALWDAVPQHGWRQLFAERHPYAGGAHHYAAYLEDADGFEVEIVAKAQPDGRVDDRDTT